MTGTIAERGNPGNQSMEWDVETPVLTAPVARAAAASLGFLFALALGASYLFAPGASGAALGWAAVATGAAAILLGLVVFGLLSNRLRRHVTVTADGYASAIADPRIGWALPAASRCVPERRWDRVERVRLDAENGRVLVRLAGEGWDAIWCPRGGFVPTAREIRRLIDAANGTATDAPPEAWTGGPTAHPVAGPLSGTAA